MNDSNHFDVRRLCFIGFGEVGQVLAEDLSRNEALELRAYDILFEDKSSLPSAAIKNHPLVTEFNSAEEAANGCDLIISAVTASQDLPAAASVVEVISANTRFLDMNSVSPNTRQKAAGIIDSAGGCYIEAAIMAPIKPRRIASPIFMGGIHASDFITTASKLGFTGARVFSDRIGPASATKMCRSVIIKGLETLFTESLTAARHYGVENEVIESLINLNPKDDWQAQSRYLISRSIEHGARRAEEMREVASTISAAGIEPVMSNACANSQAWASQFRYALANRELSPMLDAMLTGIKENDSEIQETRATK